MSWAFSSGVLSITPNTANDNFTLVGTAAKLARIKEVRATGGASSSTPAHTDLATSTAGTTPVAATNIQKLSPNSAANSLNFYKSWTSQPSSLVTPGYLGEDWNQYGGVLRWLADPEEGIYMLGAACISCRNSVGVGTSSYFAIWMED